MKKDLNSLIEQALENIKNDREETEDLLSNLREYMNVSLERYSEAGPIAAKMVETLQRSNEQLVKIASLVYKKESENNSTALSEEDKNSLFEVIQGEK